MRCCCRLLLYVWLRLGNKSRDTSVRCPENQSIWKRRSSRAALRCKESRLFLHSTTTFASSKQQSVVTHTDTCVVGGRVAVSPRQQTDARADESRWRRTDDGDDVAELVWRTPSQLVDGWEEVSRRDALRHTPTTNDGALSLPLATVALGDENERWNAPADRLGRFCQLKTKQGNELLLLQWKYEDFEILFITIFPWETQSKIAYSKSAKRNAVYLEVQSSESGYMLQLGQMLHGLRCC